MPAISTAIGLGLASASAISGAIGKKKAANAQTKAANSALSVEQQNQTQAVQRQEQALNNEHNLQQPYQRAGIQGTNSLTDLLKTPGQGLLANYGDFKAPTLADAENMPGYQFEKQELINSLDSSAAAKGNLFSGTQGEALENYGNQLATTNYQQAYENAMSGYMANRDTFETNQGNTYNRLRDLMGVGQHATDVLTNAESGTAGDIGNILVNGGQQQAQQINNAGAATASGDRGVADAISSGLNYGANYALDVNAQQRLAQENAITTPYNPNIFVNRGSGYGTPPNMPAPMIYPGIQA